MDRQTRKREGKVGLKNRKKEKAKMKGRKRRDIER